MSHRTIPLLLLSLILILFPACASKQPVPSYQPTIQLAQKNQPTQPGTPQHNSTQTLLNQAYAEWAGAPHKDGGLSKNGIDCSGFVYLVFKNTLQTQLPRTTKSLATTGKAIAQQQLKPGDLVLFKIRSKVNHVGIYTGNDQFIHASKSKGVWRSQLSLQYWQDHYWQSRRVY
jgi:cell wall-associated NlpC family hydrolase